MNYRTIIGGAFLAVTIAACTSVVAAPGPSNAAPPVRDQYYKDSAAPPVRDQYYKGASAPTHVDPMTDKYGSSTNDTDQSCRRQCP